ncbi:hypothetical protein [Lonepinella sp. BR2474]|uniref:hypothetical protein n=1 Tax=Lonepinella sp. BR2474 TaxID=3434548 RepID=UPI003F6E4362
MKKYALLMLMPFALTGCAELDQFVENLNPTTTEPVSQPTAATTTTSTKTASSHAKLSKGEQYLLDFAQGKPVKKSLILKSYKQYQGMDLDSHKAYYGKANAVLENKNNAIKLNIENNAETSYYKFNINQKLIYLGLKSIKITKTLDAKDFCTMEDRDNAPMAGISGYDDLTIYHLQLSNEKLYLILNTHANGSIAEPSHFYHFITTAPNVKKCSDFIQYEEDDFTTL